MPDNYEEEEKRTRIKKINSDATRIYEPTRTSSGKSNKSDEPLSSTGVKKPNRSPGIAIGTVIAQRFIVEQLLGHGGMSVVYRARDLEKVRAGDPNPYVAIKILRTNLTDNPDAVVALQRETKKGQMLAHPHIVTMHDFQTDPQLGLSFAQMEELHGYSLKQLIEESPTGLKDKDKAISIILSIADGLEYAHKRGIVHSDLKPSNVFVTDEGQVKIIRLKRCWLSFFSYSHPVAAKIKHQFRCA
jgi:serine/threonine protein kinase